MSEANTCAPSNNRKKRGVVRASVTTRLRHGFTDLKSQDSPDPDAVQCLTTRLQTLTAEFKVHYYAIIELLDETALQGEQDILNDHEDDITQLADRLEKLLATCSVTDSNATKIATKHLDNDITIFDAISIPLGDDAVCLLQQYEEQLNENLNQSTSMFAAVYCHTTLRILVTSAAYLLK